MDETLTRGTAELSTETERLRLMLAKCRARILELHASASRAAAGNHAETQAENPGVALQALQTTGADLAEAEAALLEVNRSLEARVASRIADLDAANGALRAAVAEKESLLEQKDFLMFEVNHRVRNSLQLVASLLQIQTNASSDETVRQQLRVAAGRVFAIAGIHRLLYTRRDVQTVEFGEYLREICADLAQSLGADGETRAINVEAATARIPTAKAIPLGLVVNELVTNAFEHALRDGAPGRVRVGFAAAQPGWRLSVADTGPGLPPDFAQRAGLGLRLVDMMIKQIDGRLDLREAGGTVFEVCFEA